MLTISTETMPWTPLTASWTYAGCPSARWVPGGVIAASPDAWLVDVVSRLGDDVEARPSPPSPDPQPATTTASSATTAAALTADRRRGLVVMRFPHIRPAPGSRDTSQTARRALVTPCLLLRRPPGVGLELSHPLRRRAHPRSPPRSSPDTCRSAG